MFRYRLLFSAIGVLIIMVKECSPFTYISVPITLIGAQRDVTSLRMVDPSMFDRSTIDAAASSILLAETEPWVQPLANVLGPFFNLFSVAMLCRVVLSWYPKTNLNEMPWIIATWPTEFLLRLTRNSIPPAFGVDITPIVWLGVFTFFNEILLGQQGLLTMKIKYGI
mmetsp:Transcript_9283/g.10258  ORF Transcript_9283/g.10258 Transcript_9283/m.10258 type:complete len:167 (-) Transcript_9283:117-617(-)